jgi:hypothetical protein
VADIRTLVQEYLLYASTETDKKGNRRAASTMNSYKRALEGFAAAVEASGHDLTALPEAFLERDWMATQQSVVSQPIQLRVRAGAIKQFTQWLFRNNIPCAPMRHPDIQTPSKPKQQKETTMSDVTYLGDAMQADPIPSTQPAPQPQLYTPPPAPQVAAPVPPPAPRPAAPPKPVKPSNPLAAMLPTGGYKLRVRREREIDDPVWVGDFPADRVAAAGAIEPFLGREVVPRLVAQGISGDVTFLVCPVAPSGQEGERARITVACVPQMPAAVTSVAAPVAGAVAPTGMQPNEMAEMLAFHRRAQEELEERLSKRMETQKEPPKAAPVEERKPAANSEMEELRRMVGQLAGSVRDLSARLEDREFNRMDAMMAAPPPQPAAPQLDILGVIREVTAMTKAQQQPVAPPPQPMGLEQVMGLVAQAKQIFQPQNVNIDVSPIEEQLSDLRQQMAAQAKGKSRTMEMLEEFKAMKEVFSLVGGGESAPKSTNGLGDALGNLVNRVIENPAPLADAVERILTATAQVKAAQNGVAPAPRAAQPSQPQIPPQLMQAARAVLAAEDADATVVAAHEWLSIMAQVPAFQKAAQRITGLLREQKQTELTIYFRQVFAHIGLGEQASPARITKMVDDILSKVRETNEAQDEEQEQGEQLPPDLIVRVGGKQPTQQAESEDESAEYEDESDDDEDESDEELEAAAMEDAQVNEVDLDATDVSRDELEEMLSEQVDESALEPETKPRRKRRTKAEMEEARAAEAAAAQQHPNGVEVLT